MKQGDSVSEAQAKTSENNQDGKPKRSRRGPSFASRLLIGLSSAVCIVLFQNCGADFVPMDASQLASLGKFVCGPTLESAFAKSYQPFAQANCVACHGSTQSPKFAVADSAIAYTEFLKTNQDTFYSYATNPSHGGGAGGPKNEAAVSAVQDNYNSCKSDGGGPSTPQVMARTQPLALAATATIALKTYTSLDTQLELGATNLGGARLHFQARIDTTTAIPMYVIARPSLQTGTSSVAVKAITIRINGTKIGTATAFTGVDKVISPGTNPLAGQTPNGNLSIGSAAFEYPGANPATDTIQFEFETLQAQ